MMLILIFIKPAFLFLFAISIALFVYLVFKKRPVYPLKIYFISLCLSLSVVGSYAFLMHKQYGVYSISSVSDINMYWMLRPNDLIDISSIENPEIKEYVAEKEANTIYEHNWQYYYEAQEIISAYSWKEFHLFIQSSLKKHFPSFLFGEKITRMRLESLNDRVGLFDTDPFPDFQPYHPFTFHHLLVLLGLYFGMIVFRWVKRKTVPVIPILFLFYVFLNLFTILYAAPEYYGRLIIPSLTVILLIIMQILEFVIHSMKRLKIRSI
jgi:hypothetical protein